MWLLVWALAGALLVASGRARAQGVVPTPEQLEIFQSLPREQQEAILRQMAGGGLSGTTRDSSRARDRQRDDTDMDRVSRPRRGDVALESLIPLLKGEDWVIIEIGFRLPPRPQPGGQTLPGATVPGQLAQAAGAAPAAAAATAREQESEDPAADLPTAERTRLEELIEKIREKNPYQLTRDGELMLPGVPAIALSGLTEEQATLRLKVEPTLRHLDVRLTRLPLERTGVAALKPFGYDLFDEAPSTFAPVTNVPVPADYVLGPGDELEVQLYGNQNRTFVLVVGRDGRINFPELGPINVSGLRFNDAKADIEARVERQMIGVRASISMADTRSIRVFVLGEARYPGSYTISGLGTITSALYAAGGVKPIGSLRNIQLKRQGKVVRELDLYDLLIRGDTTDDARLLPGDVIFVPPVGPTVSIEGEVRRPAIYEIKGEATVNDLVELAGGLTPEADISQAMLTRIDENRRRIVLPVDPTSPDRAVGTLRKGDLVRIPRLRPTLDQGVLLQGHVYTPGAYAYRDGMRLTDVIRSIDDLKPNADLRYVLIRRELPPDRRITVLSADLAAALYAPGSEADVPLMPRDRITVFDLESGRDHIIKPLLQELQLQSGIDRPTEIVKIDGQVKVPGEYPLEPGMTVSDLIRAGGGLSDAAYRGKAELTRYTVKDGESRVTELVNIDLEAVLRGDPEADIVLGPFDSLSIKEVPQWGAQETVTLLGEVRFPGRYAIRRGETLKSVLARAGGLTPYAFPEGSVFTREDLKEREQEQLDMLAARLQNDLATLALQGAAANQAQAAAALSVGQSLLAQIRGAQAVGRLVIDLPRLIRARQGSPADIVLRDGDQLIVPRFRQEVTVIGEVQNATSHLYSPELDREDYIALSGGVTRKADTKKIYVVRANGSVVSSEGNRWFHRDASMEIKPGDTVVVPLDTERLPALPFWQSVTQIIYNLAIAAAAVNSF